MNFHQYKTLFYIAWFVRVNGYIPSSSELVTFIPIAQNIALQSMAYGLAKTGFDGGMSPLNYIPLTSIVPASVNFILGQPSCQEATIAAALVSAGTATVGSLVQIQTPSGHAINVAAGSFLYAIAQFLAEHNGNGTAFVNIHYSPTVTTIQLQGAVYYLIVFYILIMTGLTLKLLITIVKYLATKIKYQRYQKNQQLKMVVYLKNQTKHKRFIKYCEKLLDKSNSI